MNFLTPLGLSVEVLGGEEKGSALADSDECRDLMGTEGANGSGGVGGKSNCGDDVRDRDLSLRVNDLLRWCFEL